MKRVSLLFILCSLLFVTAGLAQTFTPLVTDVSGDNQYGGLTVADVKALSYRFNTAGDSIYFKIETHDDMMPNSDLGFMFGIDTNLVGGSGTAWNGANTSMHYDHVLFLEQNGFIAPGDIYAQVGLISGPATVNISVQKPDTKTLIVGLKLSQIDNDGNFNFLFGSGFFDIQTSGDVHDEAPETTYLKVRKNAAGISTIAVENTLALYPNPAADRISWNTGMTLKGTQGHVSGMNGKLIMLLNMSDGHADVQSLAPGTYLLQAGDAAAVFMKQ